MDLKELGAAMAEALTLRGMIDALDERINIAGARIDANKKEISRLEALQEETYSAEEDKQVLVNERESNYRELTNRLTKLDEVGVKLPLQGKFGAGRVSL